MQAFKGHSLATTIPGLQVLKKGSASQSYFFFSFIAAVRATLNHVIHESGIRSSYCENAESDILIQ